MSHKVRVDVAFASLEEYQAMKNQLDQAEIKFDSFVTYCLNLVWNQMLAEYKQQQANAIEDAKLEQEVLKEMADEATGNELTGDSGPLPESEGLDTPESANG